MNQKMGECGRCARGGFCQAIDLVTTARGYARPTREQAERLLCWSVSSFDAKLLSTPSPYGSRGIGRVLPITDSRMEGAILGYVSEAVDGFGPPL